MRRISNKNFANLKCRVYRKILSVSAEELEHGAAEGWNARAS